MSFRERFQSWLSPHTDSSAPVVPLPDQPSIAEQVSVLESMGLRLREPFTVEAVSRSAARGVTRSDLPVSPPAPRPIPPYRRAAYWWLLHEEIGGQPPVVGRHSVFPPSADPYYTRKPKAEKLHETAVKLAERICADTGAPVPTITVQEFGQGSTVLEINGQSHQWGGRDRAKPVRDVANACATDEFSVLLYQDHHAGKSWVTGRIDLIVVPREHEAEFVRLLKRHVVPTAQAAAAWYSHRSADGPGTAIPAELMTSGLAAAQDVPMWQPAAERTQLDKRLQAQDKLWTEHAEATNAQARSTEMSFAERLEAVANAGIELRAGITPDEARQQVEGDSWQDFLTTTDADNDPVFRYVFAVPDSPLDSFETDWPPIIEDLAEALDRDDVTDISAHLTADGDGDEDEQGSLELTVAGTKHVIDCEYLGKYVDRLALSEIAELLTTDDRQELTVDDTCLWPLKDHLERLRELTRAG